VGLAILSRSQVHFDVLAQWLIILRGTYWPGPTFTHRDLYPAEGRNVITEGALGRDDWDDLLWVDSDHLPSPAFIERLAEYPLSAELVVGTYFAREYPFKLQAWDSDPEREGLFDVHPARVDWLLDHPGLHEVAGGGTGWMLIRRSVLERLRELKGPGNVWEVKGLSPELRERLGLGLVLGEDVMFCTEARSLLGVQTWLDTDPRIESAHLGQLRVTRQEHRAAHFVALGAQGQIDPAALAREGRAIELPANRAERRALAKTTRA